MSWANSATTVPAPPGWLGPAGREFWLSVVSEYEIPADAMPLLGAAGKQLDRQAECREILGRETLVGPDRFGAPRLHPAAQAERDAALAFLRLRRELNLDSGAIPEVRAPRRPGTGC